MDFSTALVRLKDGARVTRRGWNGQGMWLILVPGSVITVDKDRPLGKAMPDHIGHTVVYRSHIDMYTANDELVPWSVATSDLLASDWEVVT